MAVDPRQVVAGFLTLSMFVMLGNMIKHDHFSSTTELGLEAAGVELNTMKLDDNAEMNNVNTAGLENLMDADEEVKPCWTKPSPSKNSTVEWFCYILIDYGSEYHISQITDAVVVARYLGATLVLPDIRGKELGNKRKFQDMYNMDKFVRNLDGVVDVIEELPDEVSAKKPAVIKVPNRVTEGFIRDTIQPTFETNNYLRLAVIFSSVSLRPKETNNKDLDATACLTMFSGLELKHEYSEVARKMSDKLKELSKKSDGKVLAIDLRTDLLEKDCKTTRGARRKGCYNADEVLGFLRNVGFSANTVIYLTETSWHEGLNDLKEEFPNTYTKDDIIPAEKKGEFLKSSNADLARALDLEICSQTDVFIPAIPGLFYGHVSGKRIASGHTQILVPSQSSASTLASDFISTYISNKNHLAYKCYC